MDLNWVFKFDNIAVAGLWWHLYLLHPLTFLANEHINICGFWFIDICDDNFVNLFAIHLHYSILKLKITKSISTECVWTCHWHQQQNGNIFIRENSTFIMTMTNASKYELQNKIHPLIHIYRTYTKRIPMPVSDCIIDLSKPCTYRNWFLFNYNNFLVRNFLESVTIFKCQSNNISLNSHVYWLCDFVSFTKQLKTEKSNTKQMLKLIK